MVELKAIVALENVHLVSAGYELSGSLQHGNWFIDKFRHTKSAI